MMRKRSIGYGALAAAVFLACSVGNAQQQEELTEAERAEVERQTEELRQRTEQLERQTEQLDAQTDELEEQNEASAERSEELAEERTERAEEQAEDIADERELEQRRAELIETAEQTLDELFAQDPNAERLYEEAYGYAVFDTTKGGLIVTGAGGTGVAREIATGKETFMHVGAAGIGLGGGLENYKLVMLFEDRPTYDAFVRGQWDGSISAQAAAGAEGAAAEEPFVGGIRVYRLTDAGLIAQVDVSGMRFWPSDDLNETQHAALDGGDGDGG